jgi:hypothetical protein
MAGSVKTLQANFEDLQLQLGQQLLPVFDRLIDQFTDFIDNNGPQLEVAIKGVADLVIGLVEAFIGFTTWYTENQDLANSIAGALAIVGGAFVVATGIIWGFNAALYANPIGLVVAAILIAVALIVAAFVVIAQNWDEITSFMGKAWDAIAYGIGTAWAIVANGIIDGINFVITAFNGLLDVWNLIAGTDFSIDLISNVDSPELPSSLKSGARTTFGREYGGQGFKLAAGGVVMPRPGGTLATIGEAGQAEAVIPLDRLDKMMGGGRGGSVYNINISTLKADASVGEIIVNAIKKYERTSGAVFVGA